MCTILVPGGEEAQGGQKAFVGWSPGCLHWMQGYSRQWNQPMAEGVEWVKYSRCHPSATERPQGLLGGVVDYIHDLCMPGVPLSGSPMTFPLWAPSPQSNCMDTPHTLCKQRMTCVEVGLVVCHPHSELLLKSMPLAFSLVLVAVGSASSSQVANSEAHSGVVPQEVLQDYPWHPVQKFQKTHGRVPPPR